MKLIKKYMFFTLISALANNCNACCLDQDVKKLKKEVKDATQLMPPVLQAVSGQSLDPEKAQDHALQAFATQVAAPALDKFNEVLTLLLANPWMEKASKPLLQEIRQSNPELPPRGGGSLPDHEKLATFMTLYKNKLNERHPQPCPHCKGCLLQKASRCRFLHEEHEALMPIVDLLAKGADMESKNPGLSARYQKLLSDVQAGNATPAQRRSSKRKIHSASKEDTYLLEIKTPE